MKELYFPVKTLLFSNFRNEDGGILFILEAIQVFEEQIHEKGIHEEHCYLFDYY